MPHDLLALASIGSTGALTEANNLSVFGSPFSTSFIVPRPPKHVAKRDAAKQAVLRAAAEKEKKLQRAREGWTPAEMKVCVTVMREKKLSPDTVRSTWDQHPELASIDMPGRTALGKWKKRAGQEDNEERLEVLVEDRRRRTRADEDAVIKELITQSVEAGERFASYGPCHYEAAAKRAAADADYKDAQRRRFIKAVGKRVDLLAADWTTSRREWAINDLRTGFEHAVMLHAATRTLTGHIDSSRVFNMDGTSNFATFSTKGEKQLEFVEVYRGDGEKKRVLNRICDTISWKNMALSNMDGEHTTVLALQFSADDWLDDEMDWFELDADALRECGLSSEMRVVLHKGSAGNDFMYKYMKGVAIPFFQRFNSGWGVGEDHSMLLTSDGEQTQNVTSFAMPTTDSLAHAKQQLTDAEREILVRAEAEGTLSSEMKSAIRVAEHAEEHAEEDGYKSLRALMGDLDFMLRLYKGPANFTSIWQALDRATVFRALKAAIFDALKVLLFNYDQKVAGLTVATARWSV
jgi:hypothetical protein